MIYAQLQLYYITCLVATLQTLSSNGITKDHYQGWRNTSILVKICQSHPSSTLSCKHPISPLYRSQFSHRSSNNSCLSRHRGLYNSNPWTMARFSLTHSTSGWTPLTWLPYHLQCYIWLTSLGSLFTCKIMLYIRITHHSTHSHGNEAISTSIRDMIMSSNCSVSAPS